MRCGKKSTEKFSFVPNSSIFFIFETVLSWLTAAFNKKLISKSPERVIRKPAEQVSTLTIFYNLQNFSKSYQL